MVPECPQVGPARSISLSSRRTRPIAMCVMTTSRRGRTKPIPPAAWRCAANAGPKRRGGQGTGTAVIGNGWGVPSGWCNRGPPPGVACVAAGFTDTSRRCSGAGLHAMGWSPSPGPADDRRLGPAVLYRGGGRLPPGGQTGDRPHLARRHIPAFRTRTPNPLNRLQPGESTTAPAFGTLVHPYPAGATSSPEGGPPRTGFMQLSHSLHGRQTHLGQR